jgi:DNA (cytosine-5)-methyltransferase 1
VTPFDPTQITHKQNRSRPEPGDPAPTLAKTAKPPAIAFHHQQDPISGAVSPALSCGADGMGVCVSGTVTHTLRAEGFDASEDGTGRGTPITPVASCLTAHHGRNDSESNYVAAGYRVRRLTPRECERLQGFPDDYTLIPKASDSARYKALGNSMAVPVMRRLGLRIANVDTKKLNP